MPELYQLKRGDVFEFMAEGFPPGPQTVVVCWGVRCKQNPPTDPWHIVFKDPNGGIHSRALPAKTPVKLRR